MRKEFFSQIAVAALLGVMWSVAASAQVVPADGKITLKQADGTEVPVQGAVVEIYRTDISGKYQTKSDKGGRYVYAGIPFGGTYTIIVSAPNARPAFLSGLRLSQQGTNNFVLEPGDGSTLTLDQVRAASAAGPRSGDAGGAAGSADDRKAREALEKQRAEYEAAKAKAVADVAKLNEYLKVGNAANDAKKYDEAIAAYDQGIQVAPDEAVFYINKSVALRGRGVGKYNASKENTERDAARADFKAAAEASDKAVTLFRDVQSKNAGAAAGGSSGGAPAAAGAAPADQAAKSAEMTYLQARAENYRIALQTNTPGMAEAGVKAIQEYIAVEPDPVKKSKMQGSLAEAFLQSGQVDQAVAAWRQLLTADPNNVDAMYGLGISLAADPSGTKVAEARDAFKQFIAKAPATDARKQEVTAIVTSLDEQLKGGNKSAEPAASGQRNTRRKN